MLGPAVVVAARPSAQVVPTVVTLSRPQAESPSRSNQGASLVDFGSDPVLRAPLSV